MRRLYVPEIPPGAQTLSLPAGEAHHARTVLRAREGDGFEILNGQGRRLVGRLASVTRQQVSFAIESETSEARPPRELVLCQAVVKGKAMDTIIEKATELGVTKMIPVQCERSVSVGAKVGRWRDLAVSAMKQCGRAWLPEVSEVLSPAESREQTKHCDCVLVAALSGERARLWDSLAGAGSVALWIGPEGDFTEAELGGLAAAGAAFISLGEHVLRAETAAVAGLAQIQYELTRDRG